MTDPLTGESRRGAVGQGFGRRHRLDEARRLLDALPRQARGAEAPLPRPRRTKTRWSATCRIAPSTSIRAPPRSTRRCMPSSRAAMSTTSIPMRSSPSPPSKDAEALTREIFGGEIGFLPWQRPGFDLGLKLGEMAREQSGPRGRRARRPWPLHLGRRRPRTATRRRCASSTRPPMARRRTRAAGLRRSRRRPLDAPRRAAVAARLMPADPRPDLERRAQGRPFHRSRRGARIRQLERPRRPWRALGTSCPDHFLRTKIRPLVLASIRRPTSMDWSRRSTSFIEAYRADYADYYERCKRPGLAGRCAIPMPSSISCPASGMISFAKRQGDGAHRRGVLCQCHQCDARRVGGVDAYVGPARAGGLRHRILAARGGEAPAHAEAEIASPAGLRWSPAAPAASARRPPRGFWREGACVVLADIDAAALDRAVEAFAERFGTDNRARRSSIDVTSEAAVDRAFEEAAVELWRPRHPGVQCRHLLGRPRRGHEPRAVEQEHGHPRAPAISWWRGRPIRLMQRQGAAARSSSSARRTASRHRPAPSAYCTAKAAEIHLARCLALEGAAHGIRVNVVNPDAVLRGSKIWQGEWRKQRADANKIERGRARGASIANARC